MPSQTFTLSEFNTLSTDRWLNQFSAIKKPTKMEIPRYYLDNPLKNLHGEIRTNISDIRRLLLAIRAFDPSKGSKPDFVVYSKKVAPLAPITRPEHPRLVVNVDSRGVIAGFPEPYQWEIYDKWTNRWVPFNHKEGDVPLQWGQTKNAWMTWARKFKEYQDKDPWEKTLTYPQNYLKVIYYKHNSNMRSNINNAIRLWQREETWVTLTKKLGITRAQLQDIYHVLDNASPHSRTRRNSLRSARRSVGKQFYFEHSMSQSDFLSWLGRVYANFTRDSLSDRGVVIFHNRLSEEFDMEDATTVFTSRRNSGRLYPARYLTQHLFKKCICCDDYAHYEILYHLNNNNGHRDIIKFVRNRLNPNKPLEETSKKFSPSKDTGGTGNSISNLVPSNAIIKQTKQDFLDSFEVEPSKKKPKKEEEVRPPWVFAKEGYLDYDKHSDKEYFPLCRFCQEQLFRLGVAVGENSRIVTRGLNKLRNYSANPMDYCSLQDRKGKSSFNLGANETPQFIYKKKEFVAAVDGLRYPIEELNRVNVIRRRAGLSDITGRPYTEESVTDTTLYMGVELEVTPHRDLRRRVWQEIGGAGPMRFPMGNNLDKGFAMTAVDSFLTYTNVGIMKSDSSISAGGGFEIVSVPGTLAWHKEIAWNHFFKENYSNPIEASLAPSSFLSGWANNGGNDPELGTLPVCGIHIHISRDALTPLQLGKIITFMGEDRNIEFIKQIAGRTSDRYAPFKKKKISDGRVLVQIGTGRGGLLGEDNHFSAVNVNTQGKPTVEFRVFRSNVAKAGFFKNLEFVHALTNWCATVSMKDLNVSNFIVWVASNPGNYENLVAWLRKKKYIVSLHKPNPKFIERKVIDIETKQKIITKIPNPGYKPEMEDAA